MAFSSCIFIEAVLINGRFKGKDSSRVGARFIGSDAEREIAALRYLGLAAHKRICFKKYTKYAVIIHRIVKQWRNQQKLHHSAEKSNLA